MAIILVDVMFSELNEIKKVLKATYPNKEIMTFWDPLRACQYGANHSVEKLYAAATMQRIGGDELAKLLRTYSPDMEVYLIGETELERRKAIRIEANGFISKPVSIEKLRNVCGNI